MAPRDREVMSVIVIARSTLVRRSPPSGEGGCDEAIHSSFVWRLWIASLRLAMTARLLALLARRIEPGIDAALEARERFQAFLVRERQELHQDHAADVTRRVDPKVSVGEPGPGEAAGAAPFRCPGGVDQEAEPPLFLHAGIEIDIVGGPRDGRGQPGHAEFADVVLSHHRNRLRLEHLVAVAAALVEDHLGELDVITRGV